jgi:enoyl-CoA hydratase
MWTERAEGDIVLATFTRPPMNYFTDSDFGQLEEMIEVWRRSEARAIVLTGGVEGRFITHFDVDEIIVNPDRADNVFEAPARSRRAQALVRRFAELPQAVIAAMNGDTMGFGLELCLGCDLRIAQRGDFRIGLPEVRLGLTPAGSGLTRMTKLVGRGRALDMILRAKVVPPEEALALGLVTELADDALEAGLAVAHEIAALPGVAVGMAKKAIHQGADLPLDQALEIDLESSFRLKSAPDHGPMKEYVALPPERRRAWLEGRGG